MGFRLAYLHLTLAHYSRGYAQFNRKSLDIIIIIITIFILLLLAIYGAHTYYYLGTLWSIWHALQLISDRESCMGFWLIYLHLTQTHPIGKSHDSRQFRHRIFWKSWQILQVLQFLHIGCQTWDFNCYI